MRFLALLVLVAGSTACASESPGSGAGAPGPVVWDSGVDTGPACTTADGGAQWLFSGIHESEGLEMDAENLYLSDENGIHRVAKDGSGSEPLATGHFYALDSFTLVGNDLFVAYGINNNEILTMPKTGGELRVFWKAFHRVWNLAASTSALFYGGASYATVTERTVYRFPLGALGPSPMAHSVDPDWPGFVADDEGALYWNDSTGSDAGITRCDYESQPVILAPLDVSAGAIAVDAHHVYWSEVSGESSRLRRVAKNGGAVELLAEHPGDSGEMALDDTYVYWAVQSATGTTTLQRLANGGGALEAISELDGPALRIVVDEAAIYATIAKEFTYDLIKLCKPPPA